MAIRAPDGANKQCEKQVLLIGLIPFKTIYALLLQISKCRELCIFLRNFFASKTAVSEFFDKYHVCLSVLISKSYQMPLPISPV